MSPDRNEAEDGTPGHPKIGLESRQCGAVAHYYLLECGERCVYTATFKEPYFSIFR